MFYNIILDIISSVKLRMFLLLVSTVKGDDWKYSTTVSSNNEQGYSFA